VETTVPVEWVDPQAAALKAASVVMAGAADPVLGVIAAGAVPPDRFAKPGVQPSSVRVAAIGHGGWFVGPELSPAKEGLLVTTCNWLLRRDERLPNAAAQPWRYPRINLSPRAQTLWTWGMLLALPALFVYLGRLVILRRRYR
jgi:hypothetical protein